MAEDDKITVKSMVKGVGDVANEFSKWPRGLKELTYLVGATAAAYGAVYFGRKDSEYEGAKYYTIPGGESSTGLEDRLEPIGGDGIMGQLSNFYYNDLNNFFSLPGVLHDLGGTACAFAIGASSMGKKVPALFGAYAFTQVPELVNLYNGHLNGLEIFWEGGKDAMLVTGAFGAGSFLKLLKGLGNNREWNREIGKKEGRSWWYKK